MNARLAFWRFLLRAVFKHQRLSIEEHRASSARSMRLVSRILPGAKIERFTIEHLPAAWLTLPDARQDKVVLHFHGGGYVLGSIEGHQMLCSLMAQTLKMKVLLPEYRLAPEQPFPAAVDDALVAYRWLLAQGYQPQNIVVSGDSAGGGLSLAMVLSLLAAGDPLPAAVACLSPWTDLTFKGKSYVTKEKVEAILHQDTLRAWAVAYCGEEKPEHPLISPVYGDFRGFPPLLIQVGSEEILLDDAIMLAEKAKSDGVNVTLKVWQELWHVWPALGDLIPESRKAFEEVGEFLRIYDNCH